MAAKTPRWRRYLDGLSAGEIFDLAYERGRNPRARVAAICQLQHVGIGKFLKAACEHVGDEPMQPPAWMKVCSGAGDRVPRPENLYAIERYTAALLGEEHAVTMAEWIVYASRERKRAQRAAVPPRLPLAVGM